MLWNLCFNRETLNPRICPINQRLPPVLPHLALPPFTLTIAKVYLRLLDLGLPCRTLPYLYPKCLTLSGLALPSTTLSDIFLSYISDITLSVLRCLIFLKTLPCLTFPYLALNSWSYLAYLFFTLTYLFWFTSLQLNEEASQILNGLQSQLSGVLDELSSQLASR